MPILRTWVGGGSGGSLPRPEPHAAGVEVPDTDEAIKRIAIEFERARRYERSVTVAVFSIEAPSPDAPGASRPEPAGHASAAKHLCPVVREAMRETDLVVCDPATRRCVVVMPEIGPEEGHRAVARMRDLCASRLECPVRGDLAVFPRDGWVFPDLVEVAEKQAQQAAGMTLVTHEPLRS
ncbi:MAG TPA: hypothetical protein PKK95_04475 [Vicinamibacterales bacterium]|nr:hypothetical protein [Vicinamibacterales bacterium]